MYTKFFGLKEPSFSITPDPQFLYLSKEHREALAHLMYGASEGGGFVLLTGEVGTGKTTICRTFLEQLPPEVDVALILNPALTAPELLRTICEEFGIGAHEEISSGKLLGDRLNRHLLNGQTMEPEPDSKFDGLLQGISDKPGSQTFAETGSTKQLIDRLNRYLLDAHARGRRPVLMIDEAQNLEPEVLEQIRLLTNLETDKHKLLQIFLIGQPELKQLLQQNNLRQLSQRITARFHLLPLSSSETSEYIKHRLAVAGVLRSLFTPAAIRRIYRLTKGVPRLINILCDRALLGAYASHSDRVNRRIVDRAQHELQGEKSQLEREKGRFRTKVGALLLAISISVGWLAWSIYERVVMAPASSTAVADITQPKEVPKEPKPQALTQITNTQITNAIPIEVKPDVTIETTGIERFMQDRRSVMALLLERWGLIYTKDEPIQPCQFARTLKLGCIQKNNGSWNKLRLYNRPAMIKLVNAEGKIGYSLVVGLSKHHATLDLGSSRIDLSLDALNPYWNGEYALLWRPPENGTVLITPQASGEIIHWLRQTLSRLPGFPLVETGSGVYDEKLRKAVLRFQSSNGLKPDGLVGPDTMIMLNTLTAAAGVPRLDRVEPVRRAKNKDRIYTINQD